MFFHFRFKQASSTSLSIMAEFVKHRIRQNISKPLKCHGCPNPLNLKLNCFNQVEDEIFDELCNSDYTDAVQAEKDDRNILLPIFNKKLESSVMRKVCLPIKIPDVTNDFMIIGELSSLPLENTTLRVTNVLYDLMSENVTVDHPVCVDCTDSVLDQMDSELENEKSELKMYQNFLDNCNFSDSDEDDLEELEAELKKLKATEVVLETGLQEFETEMQNVKDILQSVEEEQESIEMKEKEQWIQCNIMKHKLLSLEEQERSVNNQKMYAEAEIKKLKNSDVFNTTFHIWHSGHFGTINDHRLGRLPKEPVEWEEINAAWGQAALLLHSLAKNINVTFERYKLVPCGSWSYLVQLDSKNKVLPLYSEGGITFVLDNRFDHAMVAFLDCLQQLKEKIGSGDDSFHLPYKMYNGTIEDEKAEKSYSIKIQFNSQEGWTKALKFMLTNLKWALAFVSTQFRKKD